MGKILLIPGHEEVVQLESAMALAESTEQNLEILSYPHKLMKDCAVREGCDFIVIDTNPFSGTLNGNLWHASDYYFVPCGPDNASCQGIRSLANVITHDINGWRARQQENLHTFEKKYKQCRAAGVRVVPFPNKVRVGSG